MNRAIVAVANVVQWFYIIVPIIGWSRYRRFGLAWLGLWLTLLMFTGWVLYIGYCLITGAQPFERYTS